ncbi:HI0074 family nucleotidyltransferase substrate-binding subunit [Brachyspira sp.]|uniref:HI0074 family nucleotidyltransferase substrate-binding subunit n=1 Tax=Brachyspira sp. TaxID=1977261 RepID=UPI003D7CF2CB
MLELEALENSILSLENSIEVYKKILSDNKSDKKLIEALRSGVIQNFEVAFEQSWKFIVRWLNENISYGIAQGITKRELFRLAGEHLLIDDVSKWIFFKDCRNQTSHIYSETTAEEVLKSALEFLPYVKYLLKKLKDNNQ